jgi:HlyD family secretion protein
MLNQAEATPVIDQTLEDQAAASVVSATGVVVPIQWTSLSMSTAGVVAEVYVAAGNLVQAGQPLVRLTGGDPQNPPLELQAAIQAGELEVQNAELALERLDEQAAAVRLQAQQTLSASAIQVRDLQYQLEALEVPEEQEALTPLEAYDQARQDYEKAFDEFQPYKDEPTSNSTRQDLEETLDQAKENYDTAVTRLQLSLALEVAQASQEQARQDLETYQDGPAAEDLALAQKRLESAQAALVASQDSLDELTLLAPFDGTVTELYARVGEWLSPGIPALVLADLSQLRVETTDLNEIDMTQVQVGDQVSVSFDAIAEVVVSGRVVYIAPKASPGAGVNYTAVIELASPIPQELRWGMSAFVDILLQE